MLIIYVKRIIIQSKNMFLLDNLRFYLTEERFNKLTIMTTNYSLFQNKFSLNLQYEQKIIISICRSIFR